MKVYRVRHIGSGLFFGIKKEYWPNNDYSYKCDYFNLNETGKIYTKKPCLKWFEGRIKNDKNRYYDFEIVPYKLVEINTPVV